jgi:hypothetical protein
MASERWFRWERGMLTWCEECGSDDGGLRTCPECDLELCFYCGERHDCNDHSEEGEAGDGQ